MCIRDRIAFALPMIDVLEELLRKIRPYELTKGDADVAFEKALDEVIEGLEKHGIAGARKGFKKAITIMKKVRYDRTYLKQQVLIAIISASHSSSVNSNPLFFKMPSIFSVSTRFLSQPSETNSIFINNLYYTLIIIKYLCIIAYI